MKISRINIPLDYNNPYWKEFKFLKQYIMQALGSPIIRVELTENHLNQSIHDAIHQYMKYDDRINELAVEIINVSDNVADIPAGIDASLIRDVLFEESTNIFGFFTPLDEGIVASFPLRSILDFAGGYFDLAQYYMARQNLETANDILGRKRGWEIINGKLNIYPSLKDSSRVAIVYGKVLDPEKFEEDEWVRSYSVASAKIILGNIRRKLSGFSAAGGAATTDGTDLINEGKQEQTDLITSLKDGRPSLPFDQF